MNSASLTTRRVAPFAAAAMLLAGLAAVPTQAASVPVTTTSFNGTFSAIVTQTGTAQVTGDGTSSNSPVGLVSEHFVYNATFFPINNIVPFAGYSIFSTLDGSSTLYADVAGTVNISNYTCTGTDTFNPTLSTGIFAGATGTAQFNATVPMNSTNAFAAFSTLGATPTPNITQQFHDGTLTGTFPAAVPETSSVVSLGLLLMLGVGGVVLTARKKRVA